jgi:hypothetical protein
VSRTRISKIFLEEGFRGWGGRAAIINPGKMKQEGSPGEEGRQMDDIYEVRVANYGF